MNPTLKAACFTVALICFILAAVRPGRLWDWNGWLAAGAAFFTFPFVWDAWQAA